MFASLARKLKNAVRNIPNLVQGYNIYVNRNKLNLIDSVYNNHFPGAKSFVDLGGVWKVNAAYTIHTLKKPNIAAGTIIDMDCPDGLKKKLNTYKNLNIIIGDFTDRRNIDAVGKVDVAYFFDVLLHQANPDWDEVLGRYAACCTCMVVYNQQFTQSEETVRLIDLPFEEYIKLASDYRKEFSREVFDHKNEIHPEFNKPWKDIHNITQWGITDKSLRSVMQRLGFQEIYFKNYGIFIDLPAFENHAFVFMKKGNYQGSAVHGSAVART
jgi:hypothetical protein